MEDWARLALRTMMDENENVIPLWWDMQSGMQSPGAVDRFDLNGGEEYPFAVFGGRSTLSGWQCTYDQYFNYYTELQPLQSAVDIDLDFSADSNSSFAINATVTMENNLFTEDNKLFFIVTSDTVRIDVSTPRDGNDRSDSEWSYRVLAVSDYYDFDLSLAGESQTYSHSFDIPVLEFVDVEDYHAIAVIQGFSDGKMVQAERVGLGSTSFGSNEINQSMIALSNYPNPFNPETTISYQITDPNMADGRIDIYNIKGELVKSYPELSGEMGSVTWNGKDNQGSSVASGVYFYKLQAGAASSMQKMLLFK